MTFCLFLYEKKNINKKRNRVNKDWFYIICMCIKKP